MLNYETVIFTGEPELAQPYLFIFPENPSTLSPNERYTFSGNLRRQNVRRHEQVDFVLNLYLTLLVLNTLVHFEDVVEDGEAFVRGGVAVENKRYIAALPAHLREVNERRV